MTQKSFFGSLLFLIYINDVVHASNIFLPMLIANDTNYFNKWKNVKEILVSCSKFYLYIRNYKLKKFNQQNIL